MRFTEQHYLYKLNTQYNDDTTIYGDGFTCFCTNSYPKIRTGEGNLPFLFPRFCKN